ncbi:SsgA family sporulation/cell division regulator [Streptomyces sp. HUAS 31]|uniref:SsgA family sporulation/cell division regulator n=1 Tax=Streptomyces sp. HUAS 31 TaxID=3020055 RepID=UPI0023058F6D|nr:SsgA family sporulation/cell division regulator [Streptomyces sp. HUAS 31]WCD94200.1 SsgA family sporulation/cell division regulator [Streptomyces sp. HUAS 31]
MCSPDLELDIDLTLAVAPGVHVRVPVQFSYVRADSYAVQISFHVTPDQVVNWMFAQALLDQGMRTATGLGEVKITPIEPFVGQCFSIELESPDGYARLEGPIAPVKTWIAKTHEAVPAGSETALLDIDRFLEEHSGR